MGDYNDALMRNQNAAVQARTKAQSRANVLQLKMIGQSHPTGLTPNLLKLFEPRIPLEYKPPPEKRKCPPYHGIAQFVSHFAEPGDPEYAPPVQKAETRTQRRARVHQLRLDKGSAKAAEELEKYDPQNDPNASGDPYKTLFVARLSYETSESRLKREFETYGPIKRVKMIYDKETNKPKGYAFIEYAHTRDMKTAYKQGDGRKIDGRRVLVDVERGRTVPNWRPRRLGGGLGTSRVAVEDVNNRELQTGSVSASRSAEPRIRDDREKEKSRERGRDKEREQEKCREQSHDRPREREDRHHRESRDRERTKDRERERDRGRDHRDRNHGRSRDHDRGRDRGRDYERDRDRGDRRRERDKDRDYEMMDKDQDRGHSYDRGYDYVHVEGKHDKDRHGSKERSYDDQGWYDGQSDREHKHSEAKHDHYAPEQYDHHDAHGDQDRYNYYPDDRVQYEQMKDDYNYDLAA